MKDLKVYSCPSCGKMEISLKDSECPTICCGQPMQLLTANTTDGAREKHVPVVTREGNTVSVNVGSVDHPMISEHYIEWIALQTEKGFRIVYLEPGQAPKADFLADEQVKAVYAYCNLHGLWKTEA